MQLLASCLYITQSVKQRSGGQLRIILLHQKLCMTHARKLLLSLCMAALEHLVHLLQVRGSPQHAPALSSTPQHRSNESLAAQTAADKAAAELIAAEQLVAIRQQQACVRTARTKVKKQKQKLAEQSLIGVTDFSKSAQGGQLAKFDCLAGKHPTNIDAMVSLLVQPLPDSAPPQSAHDTQALYFVVSGVMSMSISKKPSEGYGSSKSGYHMAQEHLCWMLQQSGSAMGWAATKFRQFELRNQFLRRGATNVQDALLPHHQGASPASLYLCMFSSRRYVLEYTFQGLLLV